MPRNGTGCTRSSCRFFWSNGAQIFTDDGHYCVISSDKAITALRTYKQLNDFGLVADQRESKMPGWTVSSVYDIRRLAHQADRTGKAEDRLCHHVCARPEVPRQIIHGRRVLVD